MKFDTKCPHCRSNAGTGTHGGCLACSKVKTTKDGKIKRAVAVLAIMALSLSAAACGLASRSTANWTGYSRVCVNGVSYLQFPSGVSVEYAKSGASVTILHCN